MYYLLISDFIEWVYFFYLYLRKYFIVYMIYISSTFYLNMTKLKKHHHLMTHLIQCSQRRVAHSTRNLPECFLGLPLSFCRRDQPFAAGFLQVPTEGFPLLHRCPSCFVTGESSRNCPWCIPCKLNEIGPFPPSYAMLLHHRKSCPQSTTFLWHCQGWYFSPEWGWRIL